jgi:4-amino-4-deoxy-L-arabinose transferase-like glycosyltransferase
MTFIRPAAATTPVPVRPLVLLALLLLGLFGYPLLLGMPLCDPDEGLHAAIAQEMVERGDWITPRILGEPFRDKPILYFWLQAASLAAFGMHEAAVRLPGMLLAALGVVTTGLVGARLFDGTTGLVAATIYGTMILPTALAQLPVHDVALVPCVNLAIVGLWEARRAAGRRWLAAVLGAGVALGLAALAKGLPGVAVTGIAWSGAVGVEAARGAILIGRGTATADDRRGLRALGPLVVAGLLALAVAVAVAAPWYLAAERRDPGYLRYFFHDRHLQGFVSATQSHGGRPAWYYLPFLLAGGLPAVLYLPALARDWWQRREFDRGTILLLSWLVGGSLFFSAASSKLPTYVWPVLPALAVLAALPWSRLLAGTLEPAARTALAAAVHAGCSAATLVLPAVAAGCQWFAGVSIPWPGWLLVAAAAPAFLAAVWCWRAGRYGASLAAGAAATVVQTMVCLTFVLPPLMAGFSGRDLAADFNARGRFPERLVTFDAGGFSTVFYLTPALRAGLRPGQLAVRRSRGAAPAADLPADAVVAIPDGQWRKVSRRIPLDAAAGRRVGHWRLFAPAALAGPAAGR